MRETKKKKPARVSADGGKERCGLCGKRGKTTKTGCCGNLICDDYNQYKLFSYARNSCARNHDSFTLCASHRHEEHVGHWKSCKQCLGGFDAEMYDWYGSNEYNFEKLDVLLPFTPHQCGHCRAMILQSRDGYSMKGKLYFCERCSSASPVEDIRE